ANITEARVALGQAASAEGLAAVGHHADVDIGVDRPGLEGLQDLLLPGHGRLLLVERLKQVALVAGDGCAIWSKAERQVRAVEPGSSRDERRDGAVFQVF